MPAPQTNRLRMAAQHMLERMQRENSELTERTKGRALPKDGRAAPGSDHGEKTTAPGTEGTGAPASSGLTRSGA